MPNIYPYHGPEVARARQHLRWFRRFGVASLARMLWYSDESLILFGDNSVTLIG